MASSHFQAAFYFSPDSNSRERERVMGPARVSCPPWLGWVQEDPLDQIVPPRMHLVGKSNSPQENPAVFPKWGGGESLCWSAKHPRGQTTPCAQIPVFTTSSHNPNSGKTGLDKRQVTLAEALSVLVKNTVASRISVD